MVGALDPKAGALVLPVPGHHGKVPQQATQLLQVFLKAEKINSTYFFRFWWEWNNEQKNISSKMLFVSHVNIISITWLRIWWETEFVKVSCLAFIKWPIWKQRLQNDSPEVPLGYGMNVFLDATSFSWDNVKCPSARTDTDSELTLVSLLHAAICLHSCTDINIQRHRLTPFMFSFLFRSLQIGLFVISFLVWNFMFKIFHFLFSSKCTWLQFKT